MAVDHDTLTNHDGESGYGEEIVIRAPNFPLPFVFTDHITIESLHSPALSSSTAFWADPLRSMPDIQVTVKCEAT